MQTDLKKWTLSTVYGRSGMYFVRIKNDILELVEAKYVRPRVKKITASKLPFQE